MDLEPSLSSIPLPAGIILMWGVRKPIPAGWRICDGHHGTPNLNDRFAQGTSETSLIGTESGSASHIHTGAGIAEAKITKLPYAPGFQFESEGNHCYNHTHPVTLTIESATNMPPSTKVVFIMKL